MNSLTGRGFECSRLLSAHGSWKLKRKVVNENCCTQCRLTHTHQQLSACIQKHRAPLSTHLDRIAVQYTISISFSPRAPMKEHSSFSWYSECMSPEEEEK